MRYKIRRIKKFFKKTFAKLTGLSSVADIRADVSDKIINPAVIACLSARKMAKELRKLLEEFPKFYPASSANQKENLKYIEQQILKFKNRAEIIEAECQKIEKLVKEWCSLKIKQ